MMMGEQDLMQVFFNEQLHNGFLHMALAGINDKSIKDIQVYRHEGSPDRAIAEFDRLNFAKLLNLSATSATEEKSRLKGELLAAGALLGVLQREPADWFATSPAALAVDANKVERLIADRNAARKAKDFKEADRIRGEIIALGVVIEDRSDGTYWRVAG